MPTDGQADMTMLMNILFGNALQISTFFSQCIVIRFELFSTKEVLSLNTDNRLVSIN